MRLYLISAVTDFVQALFIFTATRYLAEQQPGSMSLGVLGACNFLSYALSSAVSGHVSDRFGRRRLIASGSVVFAASFVVALQSLDPPLVYVATMLSGAAAGMIFPPVIAMITAGQVHGDHGRAASAPLIAFCLWWNAGVFFGQSGGGLLFGAGTQVCLVIAMLAAGMIAPLVIGLRRVEPAAAGTAEPETKAPPARSATPRFFAVAGWFANIGCAFTMSLVLFIFPKLATSIAIPAETHGFMLGAMRLLVIGVYVLLHFTTFWRHRMWPSLASQAIAVCGLLLLAKADGVVPLTAGLMLAGVMTGYVYFSGMFYSTTSFKNERKGLASGLHEATLAIGFTGGSLGGAYIADAMGVRAAFEVAIAVLLVFMALQFLARVFVHGRNSAAQAASPV